MTAFLAGALFGAIFAGAVAVAFVTRFQRPREIEEWDDPFADPPPVQHHINRQLIRERTYNI